jgi:hypothetical protein
MTDRWERPWAAERPPTRPRTPKPVPDGALAVGDRPPGPRYVQRLQAAAGNRAVTALVQRSALAPPVQRNADPEALSTTDSDGTAEAAERASKEFLALVKKVRKGGGKTLDPADVTEFERLLADLPSDALKRLEKDLLLWSKFGAAGKMTQIIRLVTDRSRLSDTEESQRGQFTETAGTTVKDDLSAAAPDFGFNECLNFVHNVSLDVLFAGHEDRVDAAQAAYAKGARERALVTPTHARTLSRLASELRLQGLLGPVNILQWRGGAKSGHHEPDAADLFDRLSGAGDGWYFFVCSLVSFHTFVIAVQVDGGKRTYFEIQGGQSVRKSRGEVTAWFDEEFRPNTTLANSRVWQVYVTPVD